MTTEARPQITEAQRSAAQTYRRRRARSAADMLLDIPPADWDEHTKRVILVTLPSLLYARELARYGEPQQNLTCPLSTCTQDAGHDGQHDPFPAPPRAEWCEYANETGPCTLPEGHSGDHDPDPYADLSPAVAQICRASDELLPATCSSGHRHTDRGAARTCDAVHAR